MKWVIFLFYLSLMAGAFFFHVLGLLNLYPLYVTAPVLFFVLFLPVYVLNRSKRSR
ncbi:MULTISPECIES: hypothetical protein [Bacillaceae]|uniref:hypothetical protein n=1 Tax=Bacillaceae TaxID=186817 RepID=UPI00159F0C15|nr:MULTISPECIES: hypothetical protein [Bacillus]